MDRAENTELKKVRKNLPKSKLLRNGAWDVRGGEGAATAGCQTLRCPTRDSYTCNCPP